jgi:hypothetical protein
MALDHADGVRQSADYHAPQMPDESALHCYTTKILYGLRHLFANRIAGGNPRQKEAAP